MRINGPRVDRRFSTTAGGDSDPSGISELLRLLDESLCPGCSRLTGAAVSSLLLRRRVDIVPVSDLMVKWKRKIDEWTGRYRIRRMKARAVSQVCFYNQIINTGLFL